MNAGNDALRAISESVEKRLAGAAPSVQAEREKDVSAFKAEAEVLRSTIEALANAAERLAEYEKERAKAIDFRQSLTSLHREHRLFQIQHQATKRELSQANIDFCCAESRVSEMRGRFNKQSANLREAQNELDTLIAILESKGLVGDYTCPACEDRFRAPGDDVCTTCHVEPCGGDR